MHPSPQHSVIQAVLRLLVLLMCFNWAYSQKMCTSIDGRSVCRCDSGYRMDVDRNDCVDVNECMETPFLCVDGTCVNTFGSFFCFKDAPRPVAGRDIPVQFDVTPASAAAGPNAAPITMCVSMASLILWYIWM